MRERHSVCGRHLKWALHVFFIGKIIQYCRTTNTTHNETGAGSRIPEQKLNSVLELNRGYLRESPLAV